MIDIQQIIPCNGDWYAIHTTDRGESIYPVAVWALIDYQVTGLIGVAGRNLTTVPLGGSITYKIRHELSEDQVALIGLTLMELEPELLEKITTKVEEHLERAEMFLSSAKKAEIIATLYKEAQNNNLDWQKQLRVWGLGLGPVGGTSGASGNAFEFFSQKS